MRAILRQKSVLPCGHVTRVSARRSGSDRRWIGVCYPRKRGEDSPRISKDMALSDWVVFFVPTATGLNEAGERRWSGTALVPWQGEQDFATYCRQVRPAEYGQGCPNLDP